jgi:anion-transporting  ArsA/GET3 family ATPase
VPSSPARLQFVMGKGGVGKTTLAASLALERALSGERVALASVLSHAELARILEEGWGERPHGLTLLELDPRRLVDDIVQKMLPLPALLPLLTGHPAYDAIYRIAPGVKELAVLHRLVVVSEEGFYDRVVVDGLATGHGTHFLETPRKSAHLLTGKLAERAREVDAILTDRGRAGVLLAATLEEMPVRETVELAGQLAAGGFQTEAVVANRVQPRLFSGPGALEVLESITERPRAMEIGSGIGASWTSVQRMVKAAAHMELRAREMEPHLMALRSLGLPMVSVPLLPSLEGRLRKVAATLREVGL